MGLIVRTAGSNKTKNEINHDLDTLINTWNQIKECFKFYSPFFDSSRGSEIIKDIKRYV